MTRYPLTWPAGWKRTPSTARHRARFNKKTREYRDGGGSWLNSKEVTIAEGTKRVLASLHRLGVQDGDAIISTNLRLRLDGLPMSNQRDPDDPGVAVYWKLRKDKSHKVMAIDQYDRIADNIAAIAATLEAMRAIERHGGARILERAFTGFEALPAPRDWKVILGLAHLAAPTLAQAKEAYRRLCQDRHPDTGGSHDQMTELNWAWSQAQQELKG